MADQPVVAVFSASSELVALLAEAGLAPKLQEHVDVDVLHQGGELPRVAVVDARHAGKRPPDLVAALTEALPLVDVVVWTPRGSGRLVRDLFRMGAKDVVTSPQEERLLAAVRQTIEAQKILPRVGRMTGKHLRGSQFEGIWSRSRAMWDIFDLVSRVAPSDATVLIHGETGTGKELLAQAIHQRSNRRGRFVTANCSSISPELIDSELFGHEKGAFTGAVGAKTGLTRHAEAGTLFLDEIGDMPAQSQLSLLRMLQEKRVRPVGGQDEIPVDVRVVAATHVSLEEAVENGNFREDLFYRIDVIRLSVPPLRERREDIAFLFGHFVRKLARHYGVDVPRFSEGFLSALVSYDWPGNVRQVENLAERVLFSVERKQLRAKDFAQCMEIETEQAGGTPADGITRTPPAPLVQEIDLEKTLAENLDPIAEERERAYLVAALQACRGRIHETAKTAGLSRRTLLRKLNRHGIDKSDFKQR